MVYKRRFEYENESGEKEFINLRPLPVSDLPKLLKITGSFAVSSGKKDVSSEDVTKVLADESVTKALVDICVATIKKSCPDWKEDERDEFVSHHFLDLFQAIVDFNLSSTGGKK